VTFVNNASEAVLVNFVGVDCAEVTYMTLQPATSRTQQTYTGHRWRIKSASTGAELNASSPALPSAEMFAVGTGACSRGSVPVPWTLTNNTTTALDLHYINTQCQEVRFGSIPAGGTTPSYTSYVGHRWRLKVAGTDRVVGESTVRQAGASFFSTTSRPVSARPTSDRADTTSRNMVRVVYAVPRGGLDRRWDLNGRIGLSIAAGNRWLSSQTGGRQIRFDVSGSALDIGFARLPRTAAEYDAFGINARDQIERDLKAQGYDRTNKKYLVFYEGGGTNCGTSYQAPGLPGNASVVFLQKCEAYEYSTLTGDALRLGFVDFVWVHEMFHGLGAAPSCAPHHHSSGHVGDDSSDLMYGGGAAWKPALLDAGRNDYWTSSVPSCPGVIGSPYIS
jgi:hypothetical protein